METYVRVVRGISQVCGLFAACLIASAVIIVCQMVILRYALNENTIWQTDFVTFGLVAATFIGSPYLLLSRGHVNVDVLPLHLGQRWRYRLAIFTILLSLAFSLVMTVLTYRLWHEAWVNNWASDSMWRARLWIPYASMPIGFGILSLQFIADLINVVTGREQPFGLKPNQTHSEIA